VIMSVTVRKLVPEDAEAYVALRRQMLLAEPLAFLASPEDDFASDVTRVRARLADDDTATFGAVSPELVGAFGLFRHTPAKAAHKVGLWGLFVAPQARGTGVGKRLVEAAVAHAASLHGVRQVHLSVSETAVAAQRLYESCGFRVWGTEPCAMLYQGQTVSELHMFRPLP
jgi:RimJ/RimL family protein N-acetyltransferase